MKSRQVFNMWPMYLDPHEVLRVVMALPLIAGGALWVIDLTTK